MDRVRRIFLMTLIVMAAFAGSGAYSQAPIRIMLVPPKPEPIAETKLLMEGLARPNFQGLGRILVEAPKDAEAWIFARGQALLIAETANLLMLRPPRASRDAQDLWLSRAADLRDSAGKLALAATVRDYPKAKAGVVDLGHACNRCHQSFRIATRVVPFENGPGERQ